MVHAKEIVCDLNIVNGNPSIKGTRVTVLNALFATERKGISGFLALDALLTPADICEVLEYCIDRRCDRDGSHCGGCSLRPHQDGIFTPEDFVNRFETVLFEDSSEVMNGCGVGKILLPGTPTTLRDTWYGVNGWIMAGALRKTLFDNG